MNQVPKISSNLRAAGYGALLAMLPFLLVACLEILEVIKPKGDGEGLVKALVIIQFIGCLFWAGALTSCVGNGKRLGVSSGGFGLCILGIMIGGIIQLLFVTDNKLMYKFFELADGETSSILLFLLLTCVVNLPIVFGVNAIGNRLPSINKARVTYSIFAITPLLLLLSYKIVEKSHSFKTLKTVTIVLVIILFLAALVSVIAWFNAASDAARLEEDAANGEGDFAPEAYMEQVAAPAATSYSTPATAPQQPKPAANRPGTPINEQQRAMLMAMDNNALMGVVNNPALYANPAFVEEARTMLTKRQGWELIKDFTDEQLLSVVHENIQGFSPEVLDAASMELLSRENADFINEVVTLSTEELQGILSNPDSYYDGYLQLATMELDRRLNAPAPQAPAPSEDTTLPEE